MANRRSLATKSVAEPDFDNESASSFVKQIDTPVPANKLGTDTPARKSNHTETPYPVGLVPITVRLRPQIAGALKRASLERELQGEELHTQQEIVSRALEPWLRNEGFLG